MPTTTLKSTRKWVLCLFLIALSQNLRSQPHPDKVYPIPNNYGSTNAAGVNLFSGNLNPQFPLAAIAGRNVGYSLSAQYNSRSAKFRFVSNSLGGQGWKLLDYPKIVKDGNAYYYLNGYTVTPLIADFNGTTGNVNSYIVAGGSAYSWIFQYNGSSWNITNNEGVIYQLGNQSSESAYTFWHLSQIKEPAWNDHVDFTYSSGQLLEIKNTLGDKIKLIYSNGYLSEVNTYLNKGLGEPQLETKLQLLYDDVQRLTTLKSNKQINSKFFTTASPEILFTYNSSGQMQAIVSGTGEITSYDYYVGPGSPALQGCVVQYSINDGYKNVTDGREGEPPNLDSNSTYYALWYDPSNSLLDKEGIYWQFNTVKEYPGGFRKNNQDFDTIQDPFGYSAFYFFNGNNNLSSLPNDSAGQSTNYTSIWMRGLSYLYQEYADQHVSNAPAELVYKQNSVYKLQTYQSAVAKDTFPLLTKSASSSDSSNEQAVYYNYYENAQKFLPQSVTNMRLNPTVEDPNKHEYEQNWFHYAFQDYPELQQSNILTKVSQRYSATTSYKGTVLPNDTSLRWKVTEAGITPWKKWDNNNGGNGWAPFQNFVLKNEIPIKEFPANINAPNPFYWKKTTETLKRNAYGLTELNGGMDSLLSSTLYDSLYKCYPVANFTNTDVTNAQCSYIGFEQYEWKQNWNLSMGALTDAAAHTGSFSFGSNPYLMLSASHFNPKSSNRYLLGAFVKYTGNDTGLVRIGFKNGSTWKGDKTEIKLSGNKWQYIVVTADSLTPAAIPTIQCKTCYVDDIRFAPVNAPFSATVYDRGVIKDSSPIDSPVIIPTPDDYYVNFNLPSASLGVNGETYRAVYDVKDNLIATIGPTEEMRVLTLGYNSKEGMDLFGNHTAGDPFFDGLHPNTIQQFIARDSSLAINLGEKNSNQLSLSGGMKINGGQLIASPLNSAEPAIATFKTPINKTDYLAYAEILPRALKTGGYTGICIKNGKNNLLALVLELGAIKLTINGVSVTEKAVKLNKSPELLNLLLMVMDGNQVFAYANGRFLFAHSLTQQQGELKGELSLISTAKATVNNFIYMPSPIAAMNAYDASGSRRQSSNMLTPDKLYLQETLYGGYLDLPVGITKGTHLNLEDKSYKAGLLYHNQFAKLNLRNQTFTAEGEVSAAQNQNRPFVYSRTVKYDPTVRDARQGTGGEFTVGNGYAIHKTYASAAPTNPFGFGQNNLNTTLDSIPYQQNENKDLLSQTYSEATTGTPFASVLTDLTETDVNKKTIQEQMGYDESMRLSKYYQPNYFKTSVKEQSNFYEEYGYDYLGNTIYAQSPDQGLTQYAYDKNYRFRCMLDANGVNSSKPYYTYQKYDALGRIKEKGIYEDTLINRLVSAATNRTNPIIAPGKITVTSGNFSSVSTNLKAGVSMEFDEEFTFDANSGKELNASLKAGIFNDFLSSKLADKSWPTALDPNTKIKNAYVYDVSGSNISIGNLLETYSYNEPGNHNSCDALQYTYDLKSNVTSVAQLQLNKIKDTNFLAKTNYTYDLTGNIASIKSSGKNFSYDITYTYDRMERIKSIGNSTDSAFYAQYEYHNGKTIEKLGKVITDTLTTNSENLLASISYTRNSNNATLFKEELFYTQRKNGSAGYYDGNVASAAYQLAGADAYNYEYAYDGFGRLKAADGKYSNNTPLANKSISYDANGNIELAENSQKTGTYEYVSGSNQVRQINSSSSTTNFNYDPSGNVKACNISKINNNIINPLSGSDISYDPCTGLVSTVNKWNNAAFKWKSTVSFTYNSQGQRTSKRWGTDTLFYIHGLNNYPLVDVSGSSVLSYIYGPMGKIAILSNTSPKTSQNNVYYVLRDHLGSTRVVTDSTGNTIAHYSYAAFGEAMADNTPPSNVPIAVRYLYTGQEFDSETGLYNYRSRMYNPHIGRFYNPDPLSQQNSPYVYVGNNPIMYSDPTGNWFGIDDAVAIVGGAVIGAGIELISQAISGDGINLAKVGVAAASGAIAGEVTLYAGPIAGGVAAGAVSQLGNNLVDGKRGLDAFDGVVQSAIIGGLTAGVLEGAGQIAGKALSALAETSIGKTVTSAVSRARGELMDKIAESPAAKKAVALLSKCGCGCFTENTQVMTANGLKSIQNIREGDSVWAYNEQNGQKELKRVTHAFSLSREGNYILYLGDNALEVTSDHPFYVNKQWIKASQLQPGDKIQLFSNTSRAIDSIHYTTGYTTVYNFEVEERHNYYVGEDGVLVHNPDCFFRGLNDPGLQPHHFQGGQGFSMVLEDAGGGNINSGWRPTHNGNLLNPENTPINAIFDDGQTWNVFGAGNRGGTHGLIANEMGPANGTRYGISFINKGSSIYGGTTIYGFEVGFTSGLNNPRTIVDPNIRSSILNYLNNNGNLGNGIRYHFYSNP